MGEVDAWRGFYGTKHIQARPSPKVNIEGGSDVPGYSVRYPDGYLSWSPAGVFEQAYYPDDACDFSGALVALREGHAVMLPNWKVTDALVLVEGLLLHKVSRHRVSSIPTTWLLREDWKVLNK